MVYRKVGGNTDSPTERTVFSLRIFTVGVIIPVQVKVTDTLL
ncbi:hypothetical protein [Treponema vincentii]|nr:hypothetical protein [Treponema vincentii]